MAVLYVDECGEEGFSPTSSEWFILGGALQIGSAGLGEILLAYNEFKRAYYRNQPTWHFHFQTAAHDTRLGFIHAMRPTGVRAFAVAIHKPSILKKENLSKRYFLYFYALRFMLERVTTYCHDHQAEQIGLRLSSRRGLTAENFSAYLQTVIESPFVKQDKMKWEYLSQEHFEISENKLLRGLQIADCVASSVGKALELSRYGTSEPRYLCDLYPMFHHDSLDYNRAIKIWPSIPAHQWHTRLLPAFTAGRASSG